MRVGILVLGAFWTGCTLWGATTLKWYPSRASLVYEGADPSDTTLVVAEASGKSVFSAALTSVRQIVPIASSPSALADGSYRATLTKGGTTTLTKDFVHTNYPWFNTSVGKADILLPGFTAIRTRRGEAQVVGRRYVFGASGLPKAIWACERQILARPVAITGVTVPAGSGFVWGTCSSTRAAFRGNLASGRVEQDGLIVLNLALPATTGPVALEIALKGEFATFFHACGDAIRCNPAGVVPSGTGRVFASRGVKGNGMTLKNFLPYCWIGTDDRGLCYAADVDRGWVHGSERDAVEIYREADGTVVLKLNLIAESGAHAARDIELCLQASPVKPMPKGCRGWVDTYDVAATRNMFCQPSSPIWGCYINGMARYPTFGEWEYVRQMCAAAKTGTYDKDYLEDWIQRCLTARKDAPRLVPWLAAKTDDASAETDLRNHARAGLVRQLYLKDKSWPTFYYYTCDHDPCATLYEAPVMRDEWGDSVGVYGSHQDYAIYYLKKMCENGMTGVYNDNAFLKAKKDWVTGGAWFDESGTLHPSYGLWSLRDHARRQIVAMLEAGVKSPWLTIHHTNANILPILSFATNTMGMEDKYGSSGAQDDWQDRWPRDYIRTVNQGYQGGFFATSIEGPFYDKSDRTRLTRTMLATLLPHEVQPTLSQTCDTTLMKQVLGIRQTFGIGADDCRYYAYYNPKNPVVQADPDVMVSTYRRGDRLLLVIGSYRADAIRLPIALREGVILAAKDAETGSALPLTSGTTAVDLPRHGLALLELTVRFVRGASVSLK